MNQLEFSKKILSELLVLENQELFEKELMKCLFWLKTDNESYNSLIDWVNIKLPVLGKNKQIRRNVLPVINKNAISGNEL